MSKSITIVTIRIINKNKQIDHYYINKIRFKNNIYHTFLIVFKHGKWRYNI